MDALNAVFVYVRRDDRPLQVRQRASLGEQPETAVVLGEAPDGLPLVLEVRRRRHVASALLGALGLAHREELPYEVRTALSALEAAVDAEARTAGLDQLGQTAVYESAATIGALLGRTMLARILGAHSPLILPEDRHTPSAAPEMVANTAAVALAADPITLMKSIAADRHLLVPLTSGPVMVVERIAGDDELRAEALQPLRYEDLRGLDGAMYVQSAHGAPATLGGDGYARAVREAERIGWTVDADDVGLALAQIGRDLEALHGEGRVHADVKPANTVITSAGAAAIDPLGVAAGEIAPGATPGWAAPEQVLARPVTPATDVYALGLMAAQLLGAAIYGQETSYVIPTGRDDRRRVRLIGAPEVFIDPTFIEIPDPLRRAWSDFIADCVAFDPERRPATGAAFADRLESLLASSRLPRRFFFEGGPGQLRRDVEVLGAFQPAWVVTDTR
jgi:hypothetical protein